MVFSSAIFVFFFLTIVLAVYYLLLRTRRQKNLFLTFASLLFYAWGEPWFVFVMLASIFFNWQCGLAIDKHRADGRKKRFLVLALMGNLGLLGAFKYLMFFMNNANWIFGLHLPVPEIALPIGISFFTFQAISYVVDVYRGNGQVQKSFWNVCLYISFFPQLIAGPIVRYQTVADEIDGRRESASDFCEGARRFMIGLAKKSLLANNLALLTDHAFALPAGGLSTASAWLGAASYILQTYYDFAGYSDMAIGLGRMFGFHFLENFEFPMISKSMTEFWRRWHISLGSWFRDYLYIPLGGSRVSKPRLVFNMFMVWSLTGLWHGAAWTFFLWGVSFFVLLVLERFTGLGKWMDKHALGHLYLCAAITTVSVIIRSVDVGSAVRFIGAMYGAGANGLWDQTTFLYLREYGWFLLAAVIFAIPFGPFLEKRLHVPQAASQIARGVGLCAIFVLSISYIVMGGYNPFIYFNF